MILSLYAKVKTCTWDNDTNHANESQFKKKKRNKQKHKTNWTVQLFNILYSILEAMKINYYTQWMPQQQNYKYYNRETCKNNNRLR